MAEKAKCNTPPIVERIIGVYHKIPQEEFEKRLPSWVEKISRAYPVPDHIAEWLIDIEERNGVPLIKSLAPKARIIHVFWQKHPEHKYVHGMRVRPDRLVFHLEREKDNPHRFEELMPEMKKWLPLWMEHFAVHEIDGITVEYYNILDGNITPQFVSSNGALKISDALTIFANIPGQHKGLTNPYDCKVRLVIDDQAPTFLDVRVRGDDRSANAVKVELKLTTFPKERKFNQSEALVALRQAHEVMLKQFACFFTETARKSFGLL
jgi:hypothetical protein